MTRKAADYKALNGMDKLVFSIVNQAVIDVTCPRFGLALDAYMWFASGYCLRYYGYILNAEERTIWDRLDALGPRNKRIAELIKQRKENQMDVMDVLIYDYAELTEDELEQVFDLLPDDVVSVTIV